MRGEFDLDPGLIYLNSGSHSICPRTVIDASVAQERKFELNPTASLFGAWDRLWAVQRELAEFVNANPLDLFFRPNVTAALNVFILGIPMPSKGEIAVTDLEYGAIVNTCRYRAERDDLSLRTLKLPEAHEFAGMSADDLADEIVTELRSDTRMLLISHIMTANGLVIPLPELARRTRERGILLVVDGAHGPGAVPVDFSELGDVDFYGGNLHKWALGPKGTAFGWVAPRHQETLRPIEAGWTTFDFPPAFRGFGEQKGFQGRMLMSASQNFVPFYALHETFEFWRKHAPEKVFARLRALQEHTAAEMDRLLGWRSLSPPAGKFRGPLLSYEAPDALAALGYEWMFRLLRNHGLQVSTPMIRGRHGLRLSPHIYNDEAEITRGISIVTDSALELA